MALSPEQDLIAALFTDDDDVDDPESAPGPPPADRSVDAEPDRSDAFTMWEYKAVLGGQGSKEATIRLNALGAEGWELVGVEPPQSGGQTVLYMKRPQL